MPRRRPSYGSNGVGGSSHSRVSLPSSTTAAATANNNNSSNSSTRHRLVPQSDASSVERWFTSTGLPTKQKLTTGSRQVQSKRPTTVVTSIMPSVNHHTGSYSQKTITRGQRLLHDRIATSCSDSFAVTNQPKPSKRRPEKEPKQRQQVSRTRIIKQRDGQRFTFDDSDDDGSDQEIPAVVTNDYWPTNQEETQHSHGIDWTTTSALTPRVNMSHPTLRSSQLPLPPPPPPPARPHRPTNATPVSASIPPTHYDTPSHDGENAIGKMINNVHHKLPFVKRHSLALVGKDDEQDKEDHERKKVKDEIKSHPLSHHPTTPKDIVQQQTQSQQDPQRRPPRRRQVSLGSEGFRQQQPFLEQDASISVSSSVTKPSETLTNDLDRYLIPIRQRTDSKSLSQGTKKKMSSSHLLAEMEMTRGMESSRSSGIARNNNNDDDNNNNSQSLLPFRLSSMRDLVSPGDMGLSNSQSQRNCSIQANHNNNDTKEKNVPSKRTCHASSPQSCSVTAATSSSVVTMTTSTTSDTQDEISQLTFPERNDWTTPQTNGTISNAETKKIQNLSRHDNSNIRSGIKVYPNAAPKRLSLHIRQPSDEEREKGDRIQRETSKKTMFTNKSFMDVVRDTTDVASHATETVAAMQALLRKTNRIRLHVYDLVENDTQLDLFGCYFPLGQCFNALNSSLHSMGTGAYHVGIEVSADYR
jgi:hypothetical protein